MSTQLVLSEDPVVYRSSVDLYGGLLFNRTPVVTPATAVIIFQPNKPAWTLLEDKWAGVYPVVEGYSNSFIQPPATPWLPSYRVSARQPEPEEEFKRTNHGVFFQMQRLYAAQLVGYTYTIPDFCDHPWLEWVHPSTPPESILFPFRRPSVPIRGQQFNLFFNQPKPWPVEGEIDTVSRLANYGIMLPWGRPAITLIMPNVLGLDQFTASQIIQNLANLPPPNITWQDALVQIPPTPLIGILPAPPPIPYGIVIGQFPNPGDPLVPPFYTLLILSTGRVRLPGIGDSTNYSPVNTVIGSITGP